MSANDYHGLQSGISVVIPVFRFSNSLPRLVEELLESKFSSPLEVILVDDSGRYENWIGLCQIQSTYKDSVSCLRLGRNVGQHAALLAGAMLCRYEFTVTMDDDFQHRPRDIENLLDAMQEGVDVVYARPIASRHSLWRRLSSSFLRAFHRTLLGNDLAEFSSSFRIFRTQLRDSFDEVSGRQINFDAMLAWGTANSRYIEVQHVHRADGRSSYTLRRLTGTALASVTSFSVRPLRLIGALGVLVSAVGFGLFVWSIFLGLTQPDGVPGFPFLAAAVSVFSGVQLVSLGIISEYLGQTHQRVLGLPPYVICDRILRSAPEGDEL